MEKEAQAIAEALRKWGHFLTGRHFTLLTDQRSVAFLFDSKQHGKMKNDKIQRWRVELACDNFDIKYRRGEIMLQGIIIKSLLFYWKFGHPREITQLSLLPRYYTNDLFC